MGSAVAPSFEITRSASFEAALKANNKVYEAYIYEGANHGFHNDSTPRYDEAKAALAWERTLGWFNTHLS